MSGLGRRCIKKVTNPLVTRYKKWDEGKFDRWNARYEKEDLQRENIILANRGNRAALERAGIIPPAQKPIYHAKEYYESRGGRDDPFLEKVLYDKKRWF